MAYKKKNRQSEDVYRQKSYFHFRFNTNSGGFFPMKSIFYLKPQGHQIWNIEGYGEFFSGITPKH
jgi:hypothetical protein